MKEEKQSRKQRQHKNMQFVIRKYQPSDHDAVVTLFRSGITEHVLPAFRQALFHPDNVGWALGLAVAAVVVSRGSLWPAAAAVAAWAGLLLLVCHETFHGYVRAKLRTDMSDIPAHFLSRPDRCFWVAEAEEAGGSRVVAGTVAVARRGDCGEVFRLNVSPAFRHRGLGSRLTQVALEFCRARGFSRVALETSSIQTDACRLYRALGFTHVRTRLTPTLPQWAARLSRVTVLSLEKLL
ncbi:probable N-acetyltransferase CML1 [Lepisosteus oculatus]|uniref:probable N-acetyltransferase CML1 n=1 Tax=Lepisosteus oculatus TaxID=7918 RepID=UPI003710B3EB